MLLSIRLLKDLREINKWVPLSSLVRLAQREDESEVMPAIHALLADGLIERRNDEYRAIGWHWDWPVAERTPLEFIGRELHRATEHDWPEFYLSEFRKAVGIERFTKHMGVWVYTA